VDADGFALAARAAGDEAIEAVLADLANDARRTRAGVRGVLDRPSVRALADSLAALAGSVLGGPAFPYRATLFDKSARANWLVSWHQDTALPVVARLDAPGWGPWTMKAGVLHAIAPAEALRRVLALRIHLDDSTAANGPLRVLPRSHRDGVWTDAEIDRRVAAGSPVTCLADRGDVLFMRPLLLHASSKAATEAARRVLHVEYATDRALPDGLELADA
jgi:ectoine hydroxylase-related dioxygenase (phytanoyl-CoA dioxygenase family)